ncbi:Putative cytochrome bd menaquinol oxidase subunit I [Aquisphaera giovannonii]|uniref:Cytochrome bd menaquinol oxidase subunit I n=1 Tax=Aquisphaera giovannonii TaxID=406548 RepID=A0A5B9VVU0_9BACT|nr:cytochrome ubiquinol oxidase subunit I [Aquisphaera giovannonii]QEH31905.1 Putative cytochrome bd menaquinol oxidase subunit I [Aquisphaera giovannonii]
MSNLLAARWQMAVSLGFHILFAVVGIALPFLMVVAEALWMRTKDPLYRVLAQRWARGAAILFAVGAVSGTVLSFELGLLWPHFMKFAGPIVGVGFALEGFAFFTEAIFLGIYIYGWDRIPAFAHWLAGAIVAASGALSGILVVSVNAWMNTPAGFVIGAGGTSAPAESIHPLATFLAPAMLAETLHMTLAAYAATGLLVAGIHAALLGRDRSNLFHRRAMAISLVVGGAAALLQPASGHYAAHVVATTQKPKLAAMEGQFRTQTWAPLRIGGLPDPEAGETRYALEIPGGLSLLSYNDPRAEVVGLEDFPADVRPPVRVVHLAFQVMVACGMAMAALAAWAGVSAWRARALPDGPWFLRAAIAAAPLGMIAIEAGWTVTEVGRQPWIIQGVMRTADAVTPVAGLWVSLVSYTALYVALGVVVAFLLGLQFRASPLASEIASIEGAAASGAESNREGVRP